MKRLGIIGFGNMGEALASGLKKREDTEIGICDAKKERLNIAADSYGFKAFEDKKDLVDFSSFLVIAVKPQEIDDLITELKGLEGIRNLISIIAGKKMELFEKELSIRRVCRFMPNLAARIGKALVGVSFSRKADPLFKKECLQVAEVLGQPMEVPERLMPAVTGISGSGIAYVFSFIQAFAMGGVKAGIDYQKSVDMVLTVLEGATGLVKESGISPMELLSQVTSPAGTTIQGIMELEKRGFNYTVMKAIDAACRRSEELE